MNKDHALESLYQKYYPKLLIHASHFLTGEEAHDVVQEVFLHLLEAKRKPEDSMDLNAYLYKAVQNKCIDLIRHQLIKEQYSTQVGKQLMQRESEYCYSSQSDIEESLFSKELHNQIASAVNELPAKGKEICKLYFDDEMSAKEISLKLEISVSTVNNHIYTCLKSLRKKLNRFFLFVF